MKTRSTSGGRLPTFVGIGPGRCASTWLYEVLDEHPEICMSKIKEVEFFSHNYHKGLAWYAKHFSHCQNAKAFGEISNGYHADPTVVARIRDTLKGVKVIACVRNPFRYVRSLILFDMRRGARWSDIEEALEKEPYFLKAITYYSKLARYSEWFGQRFFVVDCERLPEQWREVLRSVYGFLGVSASFEPPIGGQIVNASGVPRAPALGRLAAGTARVLRVCRAYSFLTALKRSHLIRWIVFGRRDVPELVWTRKAVAMVQEVVERQRDDVVRLVGEERANVILAPPNGVRSTGCTSG